MNSISKISLLLIAAVLVGCANHNSSSSGGKYVSRSDQIWNQNIEKISISNENAKNCYLSNRNTPEGKIVYGQIIVEGANATNKYDLLSSKAKLNSSQKSALKKYLVDQNSCRQQRLSDLNGYPHADSYQKSFVQADKVFAGLLNGSLTIGQANEQIEQIRAERKAALAQNDAHHRKLYDAARQREFENDMAIIQMGMALSGSNRSSSSSRMPVKCTSTSFGGDMVETNCY